MSTPTLADVLPLVEQLTPDDKLRLIACIIPHLRSSIPPALAPAAPDAWQRLAQLRADIAARLPDAAAYADQVEADRRTRQEALECRDVSGILRCYSPHRVV